MYAVMFYCSTTICSPPFTPCPTTPPSKPFSLSQQSPSYPLPSKG